MIVVVVFAFGMWWLLSEKSCSRTPPEAPAASPLAMKIASIPSAGDYATVKGCAGFTSEESQERGDRASLAGDKEAFASILNTTGARHMAAGERVRVTGYGQKTGHFRVEDSDGKGGWVQRECVPKAP
ncbi:hypothetical protein BH11MYX4_BH11MYX4_03840 [soil metagenome]